MSNEKDVVNLLKHIRDLWEDDRKNFEQCVDLMENMRSELLKIYNHFDLPNGGEHPMFMDETKVGSLLAHSAIWLDQNKRRFGFPREITIDVNDL